jgi:hypothetical protein
MYHDFEKPFECIFYILHIQKSDLDEVRRSDTLSGRIALRTVNLRSGHLKKLLWYVDKAMFVGVGLPCKLILCFLVIEKSDFDEFG